MGRCGGSEPHSHPQRGGLSPTAERHVATLIDVSESAVVYDCLHAVRQGCLLLCLRESLGPLQT